MLKLKSNPPLWWSKPSAISRYGIAVLSIAVAVGVAELAVVYLNDEPFVTLFLCGIMFAAWFGGFGPGLFVGGDEPDLPRDNLDLERWFRQPKGHERRIHGRRHAGVRIVQEGPTLLLALDAHLAHPEPFGVEDLRPYSQAQPPGHQMESIHRRKVMRKARSKKKRGPLLAELECRYLASS